MRPTRWLFLLPMHADNDNSGNNNNDIAPKVAPFLSSDSHKRGKKASLHSYG